MGKKSNLPVLVEGTMLLKTLQRTKKFTNAIFIWRVKNYSKLKYGVLYYRTYKNQTFDCVFKLFINRNHKLYVAALCNYSRAYAKFCIYNGAKHPLTKEKTATEFDHGLYVAEFIDNFLICKDGVCKETGSLTIAFRLLTGCTTETQYNSFSKVGTLDLDELCHDIQKSYLGSTVPDFVIKVADGRLKTHKCALYARSEFFKGYFEKHNGIDECAIPEATAGIMHEVLMYIYSGELSDLNTKCMVKVLEIAYLLKIPSLKDRCLNFFDETDSWESIENVEFFEYGIHE